MENARKRFDVKFSRGWDGRYGVESYIASPDFHSLSTVSEDFIIIQKKQTKIEIMKPIYIGLSVLDISKTLMYDFHYSKMKKWTGSKAELMYMDTDSFVYFLRGMNIYEVIKEHSEYFDTSNFSEPNPFGIERKNKKVPGKWKSETAGDIITEFIALAAKSYSLLIQNQPPIIKVKGVKRSVVKRTISHEDFRDSVFNRTIISREQNIIRSRNHNVHTECQKKIALNPLDNKRYLIPDSIDTLPWGHIDIPEEIERRSERGGGKSDVLEV